MDKGKMLVLLGESGCGKTSVLKELEKRGYKRIITYTTRPKRAGEKEGVDYHFISEDKFLEYVYKDFFVEHASYRGWRYGTAYKDCGIPGTCIALTPAGMRSMKREHISCNTIYLNVDRKSRFMKLLERGDDIEEAYRRSLSDVGQFDGVEKEVDFVVENPKYNKSVTEITEELLNDIANE